MPVSSDSHGKHPSRLHHGLAAVALLVLVLAVYGHSVRYDFIYDDYKLVLRQPPLQSVGGFFALFAERHWQTLPYYRPVSRLTMVVQKEVHGDRPAPFHLFNVLLMAAVGFSIYELFQLPVFGLRRAAALLGAALVAVHPIASSTVYPICSGRETLLPTLFSIAAVAFYLTPGKRWYVVAIVMFALALLSKEQAVVVPLIFLLADLSGISGWNRSRPARAWVLRYAPLAAIVGAYLLLRSLMFGGGGEHQWALLSRPAGPLLSSLYAMQTIVAPFRELAYEPQVDVWISEYRLLAAIGVLAATGLAAYHRWPDVRTRVLFWMGWMCIALLPTANFLKQEAPFAERYLLMALVASVAAGVTVWDGAATRPRQRRAFGVVALLLLVAVAVTSHYRGRYYRDNLTFHRQWVRTSPSSDQAQRTLGWVLLEQGRLADAAFHLRESLELNPANALTYNNLGTVALRSGDAAAAMSLYERALKLDPHCAEANYNVGMILAQRGDLPSAAEHFRRALRVDNTYAEAANGLGIVLAQKGDLEGAFKQFERAVSLQPSNAEAHNNLAQLLATQRKWRQAAVHYRIALRLQPDYPRAREGLRRATEAAALEEQQYRP